VRRAPTIRLHASERRELAALAELPAASPKMRLRARVVLRAASGATNQRIAGELSTDPGTVARWRRRYLLHGTPGLLRDAPRPGRPTSIPDSKVELVVRSALEPNGHWGRRPSARATARATGVSKSSVQRIWRARGVRIRDPRPASRAAGGMGFLNHVTDMVGLYLDPPERAIAFATDERAVAARTANSDLRDLARLRGRSHGVKLRAFLQVVERETPAILDIHLLLDSRLAPTPPVLDRWLSQRPRFHLHYLPSDRTGLTLIDRLVVEFSRRRSRPGETASALRLRHAIREHLRESRGVPRPFVWTTATQDVRSASRRSPIRY
jgi:Homeodomain-like domain